MEIVSRQETTSRHTPTSASLVSGGLFTDVCAGAAVFVFFPDSLLAPTMGRTASGCLRRPPPLPCPRRSASRRRRGVEGTHQNTEVIFAKNNSLGVLFLLPRWPGVSAWRPSGDCVAMVVIAGQFTHLGQVFPWFPYYPLSLSPPHPPSPHTTPHHTHIHRPFATLPPSPAHTPALALFASAFSPAPPPPPSPRLARVIDVITCARPVLSPLSARACAAAIQVTCEYLLRKCAVCVFTCVTLCSCLMWQLQRQALRRRRGGGGLAA